jgi:phosphotransferase system enzyme I (PtsI)
LRERAGEHLSTADGTRVRLDANVELPAEAALALQEGAAGIGLYRTEFLYLDRAVPPSEEEQLKIYCDVAQVLAPRPVIFRTFDIGGDKLHGYHMSAELSNPALGLRALRLAFANPALFKTQLRAILRSTAVGHVGIMFPLVTSVDEIVRAKAMLLDAKAELDREGVPLGPVRIGCMIEVPSAALMADELARHCDFFSVGTNDLVQYTLAADRANPRVAHLASPLHPAVLRLLDITVQAGRRANIDVAMCGGMAADPFAIPLVLGLGFTHVSTDLGYLPVARATVERIDLAEARELAKHALACATTEDVRRLVIDQVHDRLGDLWLEQGIELKPASVI